MRPKTWLTAGISVVSYTLTVATTTYTFNQDFHDSAYNFVSIFLNDATKFNNLMDHGCWCAYIDPNNNADLIMGPDPIDTLDEICRNWYLTRHCNDELIGGSCKGEEKTNFSYAAWYDPATKTTGCESAGAKACEYDSCLIDANYVRIIDDYLSNLNVPFTPVQITATSPQQCGTPVPTVGSKECVGTAPNLSIETRGLHPVTCTCEHGSSVGSASCTLNDKETCISCNTGYHLDNKRCKVNTCTCLDGTPATGDNCPTNGEENCHSCSIGFNLENGICKGNTCTCSMGTAATGATCPSNGMEVCVSCQQYYHNNGNLCSKNVCECPNGRPSRNCESNNQERCRGCNAGYSLDKLTFTCLADAVASCDNGLSASDGSCISCYDGYRLENGSCLQNTCSCTSGYAATGSSCTTDNANICSSCIKGYEVIGTDCVKVNCACDNGVPARKGCTTSTQQRCRSCDSGYSQTSDFRCEADGSQAAPVISSPSFQPNCYCNNGKANMQCTVNDRPSCKSCYNGYYLDGTGCKENTCTCGNGVGKTNTDCTTHNAEQCESCNVGYALHSNGRCIKAACSCQNGVPAKRCADPTQDRCRSCFEGYTLDRNTYQCLGSACQCDNGRGAEGAACPDSSQHICVACDDNYVLKNSKCSRARFTCTCNNGSPASNTCPGNGVAKCASCDRGYNLVGDSCQTNSCKCTNGNPVQPNQCMENNANHCSSCQQGYYLQQQGEFEVCSPKQCACPNGVGYTGVQCPKNGEIKDPPFFGPFCLFCPVQGFGRL